MDVREVAELEELRAMADLFAAVWRSPAGERPISHEILRALAHAGSYVAGAFDGGRLLGGSAGFVGFAGEQLLLHSHITGVAPDVQGRHVGLALKLHQRDWCLERAIDVVTWTFDPLIRRNAWFNLQRLGARIVGFEPDFYGAMTDGVNAGDASDRCLVRWDLADAGERLLLEVGEAVPVLTPTSDGLPMVVASDADVRACFVPEDAVALRVDDPGLASAWRFAFRDAFGRALDDGLVVTGITRDGWYLLARPPGNAQGA